MGHFSTSSTGSSPNCYGSAAKGAGYHCPVSSLLPKAGKSTKKPARGMTALLEKCIPAALLKLQATAQLFAFTNIFKEAFLGSDRTCLQMQTFQKKKEGRRQEKETSSWISSFPFRFQPLNKMSIFSLLH